jgi:ABC-type phosphonate transport system ATPase subunit
MVKNDAPLSVRGLCKKYPAFTLDNVSFDLAPGAIPASSGATARAKPPR